MPTPVTPPPTALAAHRPGRWPFTVRAWLLLAAAAVPVASAAAATRPAEPSGGWPASTLHEARALMFDAPAGDAAALRAAPATDHDTPWWMAFDDATLNLLVWSAQRRQAGLAALQTVADAGMPERLVDDARRQAVASYLGVRVLSARGLALDGVASAAARQQQLLAASTPADARAAAERSELLASLALRRERVGQQRQALAVDRDALLQQLATLCGLPTAQLGDLLSPLLAQASVPSFGSAVPAKLPRSILRARADVAAAEAAVLRQLRSGSSHPHEVVARMQQPEGWIDAHADTAAGSPPVLPAAATDTPELIELNALLDQAAQEVAQDLHALAEQARLQTERAQLADASRTAFLAARERLKTGEVSELQVLEQYQRLLAESDRYAAACGELAMAWVRLVASTGASEQVLVRR